MSSVLASAVSRSSHSFIPAASKAAGMRFGSSWAHNQMHGSKMFDAKLERLSKMAAQRGVRIRQPAVNKTKTTQQDMIVAAGTVFSLTAATAYLAIETSPAHCQKQEKKSERRSTL
mmetsp:Transcript_30916/g.62355  ORF Transcript_30916/g.62355 Transcript_30916/m.62355 type:complete len:116 (+) Transcript_30916:128-475(+)